MNPTRVRLLIWKEFTQLRRDPMLVRLLLLMPVLQLIMFGYVVAVDITHLRTAVVDLDHSVTSRALTQSFAASDYFTITEHPASENDLRPMLDTGDIQVAIVIPAGTEQNLQAGGSSSIGIVVDGSDSQVSAVGSSYAAQIIAGYNNQLIADTGMEVAAPGVDAQIRVMFNPTMDPLNTMIPGLVATIMMVSLMAIMSQAVVKERESGTLEQMFVTPIRAEEYLIGKVTPYALLATVQMLIVAAVGILWFRVPFNGDVGVVLVGLGLFMLTCIGLGLFVSLVSHTRQQAQQAMMFIMMPSMVLSGFIFPIDSMPALIQPFTGLIPLTWIIEVLRGAFVKGSGFAAMAPQLLVLAAFAAVIFTAAVIATRRRITE